MSLSELRKSFEQETNRSISLPVAGTIVWFIIALLSTQFPFKTGLLILLFGSGTIFPIALLIAKFRHEAITTSTNPLAKLMGSCVLMVNLLWAVHIPLFIFAPEFVPLSVGIGLGLHWVVYSWIIQHPLGLIHAILRTIAVLAVWFSFPEHRLLAVGLVIVAVYLLSIFQMLTRAIEE
ncbi:hypothetical protein Q4489_12075 [Thalassotalea sp. 1_MG-2023]|uniref:DUF7010 family protein n=1 Tax=Thalassotalea sp. 1_MG-2023 TaxID=3062680 RepID=UPI0026E3F67D|nr:hypothetical protein [Thalassotalea sp. 1_MG-2023]MDO6427760.1 hypothetical protein [Thalassotalea sp. 1_MG-2023]